MNELSRNEPPRKELLRIDGLSKHFRLGRRRLRAVEKVSLTVHEQEVVGLVGESGSGKSTLGKTILGLHARDAGRVTFRGEKLPARYGPADFRRMAPRMQMIFQDPYSSLNPRLTVGEIIAEGLRLHTRRRRAEIREEVARWLNRVGLQAGHMSRYPHEFSGGQRQRIGIARALIMEPEFVVCDEPISALDVSVQAQVVNLLNELRQTLGLTMLFIAHDLSMVRYVSDRMAVMYLGEIVEIGKADDIYFNPRHPYTRMLVASNPEPDPETERRRRGELIRGEIPSPLTLQAGCRFAERCPEAQPVCRQRSPELLPLSDLDDRQVACHLHTDTGKSEDESRD